jgi:large subunit ribosomal protein L22
MRNTQQLSLIRSLSSIPVQTRTIDISNNNNSSDFGATASLSPLLNSQTDAENFAAFVHANRHHKVKPFILKRRRQNLKTYIGNEKNIRHSPWRMNLVCQFAHGLTVPEALKQLLFCQKVKAPLVAKVIRRTANLADIRDGVQPSQLEVAECFTTHGTHLKRLKIMGRGRAGKKLRRFSHIRLVLREIDFPTKILEAKSINQKRKWLERLAIAREDYEKARVEKEELAELERLAAEVAEKQKEKEAAKE